MSFPLPFTGSTRLRGALALAGWLACTAGPAGAALISVDFGVSASGASSPTYSGADAAATAANAGFGAANVWNGITFPVLNQTAATDPTYSNLVDSTGAATGVGLSLTGSLKGFTRTNNEGPDALRQDYLFFNASFNPATTLSWAITGLTASGNYDLFFYAPARGGGVNPWEMRVDGTAADQSVSNFGGTAFFDDVKADASGKISGSLLPTAGSEVNWAGFQILADPPATGTSRPVPEPPVLAVVGAALLGFGITSVGRVRRSARALVRVRSGTQAMTS